MPSEYLTVPSHLFTVRVWCEDLGDRQIRWRGQVKHVLSGETRWVREWDELRDQLEDMLRDYSLEGETSL